MSTNDLPLQVTREEKRFLMEAALLYRDARRYAEAQAVFEGILPLVEDKHLVLIGLGSVHFEQQKFDEAIEAFEEATRLQPRGALAYAHLGEALAFARHREEAELALKKAIELDPGGQEGGEMARTIQRFLAYGLL